MPTKLPSSSEIIIETARELGIDRMTSEQIKNDFEIILKKFFERTLNVLERHEKNIIPATKLSELLDSKKQEIAGVLTEYHGKTITADNLHAILLKLFTSWYEDFREVFLSVSQSRKTRGGRDFELEILHLLELLEIPFQKQKRLHRVDFILPSNDFFQVNRNKTLILSAKRTLRERWREVVEELYKMRSPNVYILTADKNISDGHVAQICGEYNIHLVVWREVKESKFPAQPLVIDYTKLIQEVIPDFQRFWKS